jgi:glycosyltransferase involved in cell wall biosynthesis
MQINAIEVSIVMPCLNEADTLETCIQKAQKALDSAAISGEIIVADNGSTDASLEIAERLGVRVVHIAEKGYGSALMGGIEAARGLFVIMGDADDSYDFLEIPKFVARLREGYDLVQGCRLPKGGGTIVSGAMPWSHRHIGNPLFTFLVRTWFKAPIHDVYCGLRGFTKQLYLELNQRCTGMEFATEMIIRSSLFGYKIVEVPITLHPDGRVAHPPHLKTFRDGWRTLRFFMLYSPRWLFLMPGLVLSAIGVLGYGLVFGGFHWAEIQFDAHTLLFCSLFMLMGYQSILLGAMTKIFAIGEGMMPLNRKMNLLFRWFTLERGVFTGGLLLFVGCLFLGKSVYNWYCAGFGPLDYASQMRVVIPGVTLAALGFQTVLGSFFMSILGLKRR